MEKQPVLLKHIINNFRIVLCELYEDGEILNFIHYLAEDILGWDRVAVHVNYDAAIEPVSVGRFDAALKRLATAEPIQYIIGKCWFDGMVFSVNPHVLIPRPETEQLCQLVKRDNAGKRFQEFSVLDIGTGSGCIPVSLKKTFPYAKMTAVDIMPGAIQVALENARCHKTEIDFFQIDILNETNWSKVGQFDMIISNPPYVLEKEKALMHRNVLDYEPHEALFVNDEEPLIFYRSIVSFSWRKLNRPGTLYLEINEQFGEQVKMMATSAGFEKSEVLKDIHGKDRFVRAEARTSILDTSYWYTDKQ